MGAARSVRALVRGSPLASQVAESMWRLGQRSLRPHKIRRYLRDTDRVRLMLGAGPNQVDGWLATDVLPSRRDVVLLDARRRFPFPSGSVDRIHSEHMIEHVDHPDGKHLLGECFRVLRPGGRIRVSTPDFDRVVGFAGGLSEEVAERMRSANRRCGVPEADASDDRVFTVNRLFSAYGHRFLYSEERLRTVLLSVGFTRIERYEIGETDDIEFIGVDQRATRPDADWMRDQSMVLEAERPALAHGGDAAPP